MSLLLRGACLALLAGAAFAAAAGQVYQWKDANGVTHASDKPPQGRQYEVRRVDAQGAPVPTDQAAPAAESPQCATARKNLELLQGGGEVRQDLDGDGKPDKTLDESERAAQKNLAEAAIKAYCAAG